MIKHYRIDWHRPNVATGCAWTPIELFDDILEKKDAVSLCDALSRSGRLFRVVEITEEIVYPEEDK